MENVKKTTQHSRWNFICSGIFNLTTKKKTLHPLRSLGINRSFAYTYIRNTDLYIDREEQCTRNVSIIFF